MATTATESQTSEPGTASRPAEFVCRSRAYCFALDEQGNPIELGAGRFARAYLGEERWLESRTEFRRPVAIKVLQRGVSGEDAARFQIEKELLERVQGHPNIIALHGSGDGENPEFIPRVLRDRIKNDFIILEQADLSLEELLKGSRRSGEREDLLKMPVPERLKRALSFMLPVAAAVEHSHLVCNVVHRDIKPANVLVKLPNVHLAGSTMQIKLGDFNVGSLVESGESTSSTRIPGSVPGTLFFQSPEQETNIFELLVNVRRGSKEVEFFEDFYLHIAENDTFQLFNRSERYPIARADRGARRILLEHPFAEPSETHVRAKIVKSVGRPADIYGLGALLYYLTTGAYGNPKSLYDAFHKFIEFDRPGPQNTVAAYLDHEYRTIASLAPRDPEAGTPEQPADPFFSYRHYLDGNGELLDRAVMNIVARAMIRNKPDSYCQAWDIETMGVSQLISDLIALQHRLGIEPTVRSPAIGRSPRKLFSWWRSQRPSA
jgi:serine/threonine protein kinase